MKTKRNSELSVEKVLEEFKKAEAAPAHRKDAFKINGSFEDAVKKIAKAKPPKPGPRR
jgi:hypothetical protein